MVELLSPTEAEKGAIPATDLDETPPATSKTAGSRKGSTRAAVPNTTSSDMAAPKSKDSGNERATDKETSRIAEAPFACILIGLDPTTLSRVVAEMDERDEAPAAASRGSRRRSTTLSD